MTLKEDSEKIITKYDLQLFKEGIKDTRIHQIWNKIVSTFPIDLKEEASQKDFKLKELNTSIDLTNFIIQVDNPSFELEKELFRHNLFIICIND